MKEVIIKADFRDIIDRNDTVTFNLKKLLNGSEQKLKDVLKKLPGISIDNDGKIKYKGKKIDDLLIEGDEFFGTQHQLATENIKSEIIEKIEVLKNFKNLSSISGFDNSGRTALNISVKEEFKNAIKGSIDAEYGIKNRFRQHNNIYNFASKVKLNLITDINNTNNPSFTVNDYIELKKGVKIDIENENESNTFSVDENIPSFLFSADDVHKKNIRFYSVNFSNKLSKTSKIHGLSILNQVDQNEFLESKQTFFSEKNDFIVNKKSIIDGLLLFNSNRIEYESKPNDRNYYNYVVSLNFNKEKQDNLIDNSSDNERTIFKENKNNFSSNVGQLFTHKLKINDINLFQYDVFTDFTSYKKDLLLNSNAPFLGLNFNNTFNVLRETKGSLNSVGINFDFLTKKDFGTFKFYGGSISNFETLDFFLDELNPGFNSNQSLITSKNYLGLNFSKKKKGNLGYSLGFRLSEATIQFNSESENVFVFLPFAAFNYEFRPNTSVNIAYKRDFSNVTIDKLISGFYLEDYRTVLKNGNILYDAILPKNIFSLNSSYSNVDGNIISFFGAMYSSKTKEVGFNTINSNNLSVKQYEYIELDNSFYSFFTIEKKMKKIPWAIKLATMQSRSEQESFINSVSTTFNSVQSKTELNILSYFKSSVFNVNFGAEYSINRSKNNSNKEENSLKKSSFFARFNGLVLNERINWEIENKFIHFNSNTSEQKNIFEINPSINYKIKKWSIILRGVNLLNIKENNVRLRVENRDSYFEETKYSSLSGFVNIGIGYSF
ncbi:hypothetical protein SGQ83_15475 [Flavobacterium sp. Fl-318]|uniref:TonB-dependent receptor n=1 Tax=Flavobacterium cupriresistens TaxID=2893885 RepID=A0ABU4RDV2_9FLAO|nr:MULTISPECIES: hypothetical protein [unclassified Flavobacterium]MDX6190759.1 hypothetical protein [Flavobacterium sp. Fl-318]UFH44067.1 hypothetical protein LNP23_07550 [Flavobacterium sp. F-323]